MVNDDCIATPTMILAAQEAERKHYKINRGAGFRSTGAMELKKLIEAALVQRKEEARRAHNSDSAEPVGDLHFVFDKMPSPDGCMLIECEDSSGNSVSVGEWRNRQDGLAELVVSQKEITHTFLTAEMTERAVMVFEGELGEADRPSTRLIAEALKAALTNRTPDDEVGNG